MNTTAGYGLTSYVWYDSTSAGDIVEKNQLGIAPAILDSIQLLGAQVALLQVEKATLEAKFQELLEEINQFKITYNIY